MSGEMKISGGLFDVLFLAISLNFLCNSSGKNKEPNLPLWGSLDLLFLSLNGTVKFKKERL